MITASSARWPPQAQVSVPLVIPVPMAGMNTTAPLAQMNPAEAVYLYNIHPYTGGVRVRDGYAAHASGIPEAQVRTVVPFGGSSASGSDAKLFAVTSLGIYEVTASGTSYAAVATFPDNSGRAGYGSFANFQTAAGSFVAYCDEVNGYWIYKAATDAWSQVVAGSAAGQINGADPTKFAMVLNWKNRLWFVERDSAQAWYLPVNQFAGNVSSFGFGSKFPHGGELAMLANWTLDGAAGVDDQLVAVSRTGDVAVYTGTDPSSIASFAVRGFWNIGRVPAGRRFMADLGGDLLVLSSRGLTSMGKLLKGAESALTPDFYASFKVSNLIGEDMAEAMTLDGWGLYHHPRRNMIIITVPRASDSDPWKQYAMYVPTGSWSVYRDVPMNCASTWNGEFYFGTTDGRVCIHAGSTDDGDHIEFSGLTAYSDLGAPGRNKRIGMIRPVLVYTNAQPAIAVEARWDFSREIISTVPAARSSATSSWDAGRWDSSVFGGTQNVGSSWRAARGVGQRAAVAFRGYATNEATIASFDVTVDGGGLL